MTKQRFDAAVQLVRDGRDVSGADDTPLHGCGLPGFRPATVTLDGHFDGEALNEMRAISRQRWLIC